MGQSQPSVPQAPNPATTYRQMLQIYNRYLPQQLSQEVGYRNQYDPQFLQHQLQEQQTYGPQFYAAQLAALNQYDPYFQQIRGQLAQGVLGQYNQTQQQRNYLNSALGAQAQNSLAGQQALQRYLYGETAQGAQQRNMLSSYLQGQVGQNQQAHDILSQYLLGAGNQFQNRQNTLVGYLQNEGAQAAGYRNQLGASLQNQLSAGTQLTPEELTQAQQQVRGAQAARGNMLGNAGSFEEALTAGQRGQQLYQQRVANMQGYLNSGDPIAQQYQSAIGMANPYSQQYQSLLSQSNPYAQQLQGLATSPDQLASQYGSSLSPNQSLSAYQGYAQSPNVGLGQLGTFLSSPSPEQAAQSIQPVQSPNSMQYVNPNAGFLGQQFGLSNYQNQLGQYQAQLNQPNPWAGALGGAASGAMAGSMFGPYGAAAGGLIGGVGGYFGYSDERLKQNIRYIAMSKNGIRQVEFEYKWKPGKKYRGVMARDVRAIAPEAVFEDDYGFLMVNYDDPRIDVKLEEVKDAGLHRSLPE